MVHCLYAALKLAVALILADYGGVIAGVFCV